MEQHTCASRQGQASDVVEPPTETGNGHLACQVAILTQVFKLIVSTTKSLLNDINQGSYGSWKTSGKSWNLSISLIIFPGLESQVI